MYNFGIPAAMKAWIDQVVRAGRTFRFTATGPEGLVKASRAWIVTASGATPIGSEFDFNSTYLRAILSFIGVADIRVIAADNLQREGESSVQRALAAIDEALITHAL
jgi:FMN-dependent NADH-azoreductase